MAPREEVQMGNQAEAGREHQAVGCELSMAVPQTRVCSRRGKAIANACRAKVENKRR